jgi:ubiquinone/menaquinone biosynthesis C-methylase UbiE
VLGRSSRAPLRDEELTAAFDAGAATYDVMVGLNPGYHRHLDRSVRRAGLPAEGNGLRLLDVGCGTGASTAALLRHAARAEIVAADASTAMLARARAKPWPPTVRFLHSPIEELPGQLRAAGVKGGFDAILAAYLVRNLADPDAQLRALLGLLRPGGTLVVHDYFAGSDRLARAVWTAVCSGVVVPLAAMHRSGIGLYRHLWRSVTGFDDAARFARRLADAGFADVRYATMPGWQRGIEHTVLATRPVGPQPADRSA